MYTLAARPALIAPAPVFPQPSQNGSPTAHKVPSPARSPEDHTSKDTQNQMERSLKRSVTLVIWYKPNCDPVRLNHEISTFPLFQLSHFPALVSDLELSSSSYIDTYNNATCHWEQHMITTVRTVETDQRLLYKIRKSLLSGLADEECCGLADEVASQPKKKVSPVEPPVLSSSPGPIAALSSQESLKRPASENTEGPPAKKYYVAEGYPPPFYLHNMNFVGMGQPLSFPQAITPPTSDPPNPNGPAPTSASVSSGSPYTGPSTLPNGLHNIQGPVAYNAGPPSPAALPGATGPFPSHPHPPLKRWPNDYTVSEVAAGFRQMDSIVAQTPTATQRMAFERVFGCRYVKSTVCRHRGVWRKAGPGMRNMYEAMGTDERAVWGEFVRRVEGRPPGKIGHAEEEAMLQGLQVGLQRAPPQPGAEHHEQHEEEGNQMTDSVGPPPQVNVQTGRPIRHNHIHAS
ncbi:hypothetical protein BV22DRAFT_1007806 [Leucogyrophana mollusca]|uniref:Uncharacterized protein n=1 Tax=Leucogyrophana mollusca TaxID=85980 RepID=A0ACB8BQ84_9AGAM|nr:hypothetical protein BV22DRAFT_1007806 [Leucogyrophana mollusca]